MSDSADTEIDEETRILRGLISRARLEIYYLFQQAGGDRKMLENATVKTVTGGEVPRLYAELMQVPKATSEKTWQPEVRVKRLEWEEPSEANNYCNLAKTPIGDYYVHVDGGLHIAWFDTRDSDDNIGEPSGSLYTEQQKCQDHYNALVASMMQ